MKYFYLFFALLFMNTPRAFSQWTNTNGPDGGFVTHVSGDGSTLFGSTGSMIYRSKNNGSVWSKIDLAATKVYQTSTLLYAQHSALGGLVSTDGGNTFELIVDGLPSTSIFAFVTVAKDSIFGISGDKVYQLDPTAMRWNASGTATFGNTLSGTQSEVFALGFGSVKSLTTSGTFTTYGTGFPAFEFPTAALEIGNSMIMATSSSVWQCGPDSVWSKKFTNGGAGFNTLIELDGAVYGLSFGKLMTSPDSGSTWNEVTIESELKTTMFHQSLFKVGSTLYAAGVGEVLLKSEDSGLNWVKTGIEGLKNPILSGVFTIDANLFATSSAAPGLAGGFGIYKSTDNGATWALKNEGLVSTRVFRVRKIGTSLYAATVNGLHVSTDDGETWSQIASTKGNTISDVFAVDETKMIIAGTKIWTTTNGGETLSEVLNWTGTAALPMIYKIRGRIFYGAFMSENSGDTWIATPKVNNTSRVAFATMNDNAYSFWANSLGAISIYKLPFSSADWEKVETTGLTGFTTSHMFQVNSEIYLYGGSYAFENGVLTFTNKIMKSSDGIDFQLHSIVESTLGTSVFLAGNETDLFLGSDATTVFVYDPNATSIVDEQNPSTFTLLKNYPNPFNPSTTISIELAKSEQIKLEVFALNGQRIQTLMNGFQKAGSHSFQFDASSLSSGVYVLRLTSESQVATHKMTLIK